MDYYNLDYAEEFCDTRFAEEEEHAGSCPECGRITFEKVVHSEPPSWDEKHEIGDLGGAIRVRYCPWCGWEETP